MNQDNQTTKMCSSYSKSTANSSSFLSEDFCRTPDGLGLFSDSPTPAAAAPSAPGGFGFTDGFNSCTESLGFESSDGRITDQWLLEGGEHGEEIIGCSTAWGRARRRSEERRRVVEFPPPLTSMDESGRRDFVLRPVRKDGRLELTEVRIRRQEIMLATRENGRLTLRLVGNPDEDDDDEELEEEEIMDGEELKPGEEDIQREGGEGEDGGEWRSPASGGEGGETAPRRCYESDVAGHRHLSVWSPRCVRTM